MSSSYERVIEKGKQDKRIKGRAETNKEKEIKKRKEKHLVLLSR